MTTIEYSNELPARLLACDHALLESREERGVQSDKNQSALVFWESTTPFVVVGYTEHVAREVNLKECARLQIPVLRRISGGGTVVQGAGCLNYSLVLPIDEHTLNLQQTNNYVMQRQRDALQTLISQTMVPQTLLSSTSSTRSTSDARVAIRGTTDLALVDSESEKKFSGNAQRRKKNWLLFHGTILLDFDRSLIAQLLHFPSRQPDYRADRNHLDFVCNFPASRELVKNALRGAWNAHRVLDVASEYIPHSRIEELARDVYAQRSWNLRW